MIPRTFPSSVASNGSAQMIVYFLPSVSGLTRWVDYIPVKFTTVATATTENTYNQNGYIPVVSISSIAGATSFKEYVPVFLDSSAVDAEVWKVNITGFIPVGTAGIGGAALYMDFAATTTLDPRVTFSRTTNATLTNSAGLVANAPMNLLTKSQTFATSPWSTFNTTVTANTAIAPDGTTTACTLNEGTANNVHQITEGFAFATATNYTLTVYAKYVNCPVILLSATCYSSGATYASASFNVQTGTYITSSSSGSGYSIVGTPSITPAENGWYRCSVTVTFGTAGATIANSAFFVYQGNTGTIGAFGGESYTGTSRTVQIWGAQLELGSTATTYNPTTVKNLLGYTEHFDNAAWTKSNASISATKVDDIYGQPFAQQVTSSASNGTVLSAYTAAASTPYTFSIWIKRVTGTGNIDISADGSTWATQTLTTEWQRFSVTASPTAGSKTPGVRIATSGDSIYIFGAQLSDSASVDPYVYNPVAAPSAAAYYGPRFDYDPVTLAPKGLLIEEQRTNLLLNSSVLGTQIVTVTAAAHTLSFYGTGTIVLSGAYTGTVTGTGAYPTRTTLTFTPIVGALTATVTGSVTMAQLEAGAFATSYIPTVASQVTRAADSASMIGNNFARWYTQGVGTIFSQFDTPASGNRPVVSIDDNTANNMIRLRTEATDPYFRVVTGGAAQADLDVGTVAANTIYKMAGGFGSNSFLSCINTGTVGSDTSGTAPTVDRLRIGSDQAGAYLNGHIARTTYYGRVLTATEDQSITA